MRQPDALHLERLDEIPFLSHCTQRKRRGDTILECGRYNSGFKAQTHNGVVGQLGLNYVSKGLLTKDEGRLYSRLLQHRITGDYNDFFDFEREDVLPLLEPTRKLLAKLESLIAHL